MRFILSLIILVFILESCGIKSDPEYQGSINYKVKII